MDNYDQPDLEIMADLHADDEEAEAADDDWHPRGPDELATVVYVTRTHGAFRVVGTDHEHFLVSFADKAHEIWMTNASETALTAEAQDIAYADLVALLRSIPVPAR